MTSTADKAPAKKRERRTGISYVRDADAWRSASLVTNAAREASRLCDQIDNAVSKAYFSDDPADAYAADVATCSDTLDKAQEALTLLQMAIDGINAMTNYSRCHNDPF